MSPALTILVPCKSFDGGKSRLAPVLDDATRSRLCRFLFSRTLAQLDVAFGRLGVAVVSRDAEVRREADRLGVASIAAPGGLNDELGFANNHLLETSPWHSLMVLPIDLPLMTAGLLVRIAESGGRTVTIAPDRENMGTNLLLLDPRARSRFTFAFGADSLRLHRDSAARRGLDCRLLDCGSLRFDLDQPRDLKLWLRVRPGATAPILQSTRGDQALVFGRAKRLRFEPQPEPRPNDLFEAASRILPRQVVG